MQVTSGRVIAGHVELETELPEGTRVRFSFRKGMRPSRQTPNLSGFFSNPSRKVRKVVRFLSKACSRSCAAESEICRYAFRQPRLARELIREADSCWRTNRSGVPNAVLEELDRVSSLITAQPNVGTLARNVTLPGVRRIGLRSIRYDLYEVGSDECIG